MTSTLTFEGYVASVEIDFDSGVMHGEVQNARDVLTFSASSVSDLKVAFADTIADYRAWCESEGAEPEKPYSGTLTLRLSMETHRLAAVRALQDNSSLNAWICRVVECELGQRPVVVSHAELERRMAGWRDDVLKVVKSTVLIGGHGYEEPVWGETPEANRVVQ